MKGFWKDGDPGVMGLMGLMGLIGIVSGTLGWQEAWMHLAHSWSLKVSPSVRNHRVVGPLLLCETSVAALLDRRFRIFSVVGSGMMVITNVGKIGAGLRCETIWTWHCVMLLTAYCWQGSQSSYNT